MAAAMIHRGINVANGPAGVLLVIGCGQIALVHRADGLGYRRILMLMGRAESTVRRWLRRVSDTHLDWMWRQGAQRLIQLAPGVFTELRHTATMLRHTLTVLAAAAYRDRARWAITDPP